MYFFPKMEMRKWLIYRSKNQPVHGFHDVNFSIVLHEVFQPDEVTDIKKRSRGVLNDKEMLFAKSKFHDIPF